MEIKELLKRSNNPEEVTLVQSTQLEEFYAFDKTLSEKAVRLNVVSNNIEHIIILLVIDCSLSCLYDVLMVLLMHY